MSADARRARAIVDELPDPPQSELDVRRLVRAAEELAAVEPVGADLADRLAPVLWYFPRAVVDRRGRESREAIARWRPRAVARRLRRAWPIGR